jgi:cellulose synthase (UDP-forming)
MNDHTTNMRTTNMQTTSAQSTDDALPNNASPTKARPTAGALPTNAPPTNNVLPTNARSTDDALANNVRSTAGALPTNAPPTNAPPTDGALPTDDVRLLPPNWSAAPTSGGARVRSIAIALVGLIAVTAYLMWLVRPSRVGNPVLFGVLLMAEIFNVLQALGFWWTCAFAPRRGAADPGRVAVGALTGPPESAGIVEVDVFIPTYDESVEIVEATVAAAARLRGAHVHVALLDDGNRDEMAALAKRHGARYIRRTVHSGAKAGNINHALGVTEAQYILVLDCDHVPDPDLLLHALPRFDRPAPAEHVSHTSAPTTGSVVDWRRGREARGVAFVQTPQYYANAADNRIAEASWSQQSLFFGPIARGKDARGAMFCCGTNVVFRRDALTEVGGFPETSVTEDFELSIELHERGWSSAYVPEVLASGLGPEDLGAYVSQQHRWARGCVGALPRVLRSRLPWRLKLQYVLSASYFLTGWTILVYLSMPVIRIFTGAQPIAGASADTFLVAFAPYFGLSLLAVATVGAGRYTYSAYALAASTFWVHIHASCKALFKRPSRFVVTPKDRATDRQWRAAAPTLVVIGVLVLAVVVGLVRDHSSATLNNVAFALFHITVLCHGVSSAVVPSVAAIDRQRSDESDEWDVAVAA